MTKIKIFFLYLYKVLERKSKYFIILGLVLLALLLTLIKLQKELVIRSTLTEGIIGTYTEENLPESVTTLISGSLVKIDSSGKPIPNLAKDWTSNKESTSFSVNLKQDLYWTDGTKVTTDSFDVPVSDVEVTKSGDSTFQFKLTDSFSPFLNLLTRPVFKRGTLIGTGPYKVAQIKKDKIFVTKLVLEPQDPSLPNLVIRFYPNEKIAKNALRLGEIQALIGINETADLEIEKNYRVTSTPNYAQLVTIFYNTKDPILSDENFRLALSYAAPSLNSGTEATTSLPPTSWAFNSEVKDYLNNPAQAKTSFDKVKVGKDTPVVLTATSFLQQAGERVVEAWNKQGIKAVLRVESGIPQNFQALLITQNIPKDPDQYSLWHSTQAQTNISKFSNPRVDKDLEDGRKESDPEERLTNYKDFQKVLLDHAPATFLYFPKYNAVYMTKVQEDFKKVLELQLKAI